MSEETNVPENDGTWSGLKKTLIGTISTVILGAGTWLTTTLFNGASEDKEETKTEQVAPAQQPVINLNVDNSSQNNSSNNGGGTNTIIREKVVEKPAKEPKKEEKKSESEDAPW